MTCLISNNEKIEKTISWIIMDLVKYDISFQTLTLLCVAKTAN